MVSTTVYTDVEVEVSLDAFEWEEIIEYINDSDTHRVIEIDDANMGHEVTITDLYQAYRSKDVMLMEKLRTYIQDQTGKILP